MGHLYHGYVSHNQRVLFLTLELLFNAESQPIRLQHGTLPQLASALSLAEPRLAMLWHKVALKFPRNDNVLIKTIGTDRTIRNWGDPYTLTRVFSVSPCFFKDVRSFRFQELEHHPGVLRRSDNGRLMDMFFLLQKKRPCQLQLEDGEEGVNGST